MACLRKCPPAGSRIFCVRTCRASRSTRTADAGAAGDRIADSEDALRRPQHLNARALHECPRAPPSPSPSRHLGARDSDQNFTERLPAGTAADEISSRQHTARSTQKAQASSGPPMRSSWSSFCPTITRTAPRRSRPRGREGTCLVVLREQRRVTKKGPRL